MAVLLEEVRIRIYIDNYIIYYIIIIYNIYIIYNYYFKSRFMVLMRQLPSAICTTQNKN